MPQRTLAYSVVDVFAEHALEGNPLAVFHDAHSLSSDEMQALARETNLAETTFILPSGDESKGVRVRIFTTQEELRFAGHPTLGTASWLYWNHPTLRGADTITLALNIGPITVRFTPPPADQHGVHGTMQQNDPTFGLTHDRSAIAAALGLSVDDLDPHHAPQTVSTGMPFCIVPLRSLEVSKRLQISQRDAQRYLDGSDAKFFYCIAPAATRNDAAGPHWHARMQFYGGEDPATGSASGCCISWLVRHGLAPSETPTVIEQGVEMRRPSRIATQAKLADDSISEVFVGGRTIPVATGSFFLPRHEGFPQAPERNRQC
ncbi:MAG TPA: PhzF family phenazine biosynthesis protein [Acidobacteriaceae bacterium]|nr:PhzF family phenazine biosynthesis protein [Acidobacteriaceae bacterium]